MLFIADGHDAIGSSPEEPLRALDHARCPRAEIALEHVALESVNSHGPRAEHGRATPQQASLGQVRVNDVRAVLADDAGQRDERPRVVHGADGAHQGRELPHRKIYSAQLNLNLVRLDDAVDEQRLPAALPQTPVGNKSVGSGPTHVQPSDDAQHAWPRRPGRPFAHQRAQNAATVRRTPSENGVRTR